MTIAIPGQRLLIEFDAQKDGHDGTFTRNGSTYASVLGQPVKQKDGSITVKRIGNGRFKNSILPAVGTQVMGSISKLNRSQAHLTILAVNKTPLPIGQELQGIIRSQDVRETDKDRVVLSDCFRPGDTVCAEVISLPTSSMGYLLATFHPHLGVMVARHSKTGNPMRPVNSQEMADPSGLSEPRKVATGTL